MTDRMKRLLSLDLLKVISMWMVVAQHYWGYATVGRDILLNEPATLFNYIIIEPLLILCHGGVPLFILITGYFLCNKEWGFNWTRILKIWFYAFLYNLLFLLVLRRITPGAATDIRSTLLAVFPMLGNNYWFISQYIALSVFAPFLGRMVANLSKRQYITLLLAIGLFGLTVWFHFPFGDTVGIGKGFTLIYFIFLFLVGGYVRRYDISFKGRKPWLILLGVLVLCWGFSFVTETLSSGHVYVRMPYYNDLTVLVPICLFIIFKDLNVKEGGFLHFTAKLAPYSLGVYLISENAFVRQHLWGFIQNYLHPSFDSWMTIPLFFIIPFMVYIACTLTDMAIKLLCRKGRVENLVERTALAADNLCDRIVNRLL